MPYIFQEEILKSFPHKTGCEKFDSMYRLYDIFKDPSYFLTNLFFDSNENLDLETINSFLDAASKKYNVSNWTVRCEKKSEMQPVEALTFSNTSNLEQQQKCSLYIQQRLSQGYNCIIHEVINGQYPSNRLSWLYSFGIYYKNSLPRIEIYPTTDAGSIKWGKLSPLDLLTVDAQFNIDQTSIRDTQAVELYRQTKLDEWTGQFKKEIANTYPDKKLFCNTKTLQELLIKNNHPLFNISQIDSAIQKTKNDLINIALKYSLYAQDNHINPDDTIMHGSLLFNNRIIIWDISTDKRWQHLKNQ